MSDAHRQSHCADERASLEPAEVGRALRRIRKSRGRDQESLARQVGISAKDLTRIEKGECRVSIDKLVSLLRELSVTEPLELLGFSATGATKLRALLRPQADGDS